MSTPSQLGFFDIPTRYDALSQQGDPLEQLAQMIPWEEFLTALENVLRRSKRKKDGRPPFDAVRMFKVHVRQALYNLSDDQTVSPPHPRGATASGLTRGAGRGCEHKPGKHALLRHGAQGVPPISQTGTGRHNPKTEGF